MKVSHDDSLRPHHRAGEDKVASAEFFAEIFGLTVKPGQGHFAQVQVNESLTFDFADEPEPWGGPGFDPDGPEPSLRLPCQRGGVRGDLRPGAGQGAPLRQRAIQPTDGQIYTRRGGRGFYFEDPYGHLLEVMTVPETGSMGLRYLKDDGARAGMMFIRTGRVDGHMSGILGSLFRQA